MIRDRASPRGRDEKKIDALLVGYPVHDAHHREVCRAQGNANLFVRLPDGRLGHALSSVEMASDHAVIAIFISGIRAPEKEHLVFTEEKNVDRHGESGMHTSALLIA